LRRRFTSPTEAFKEFSDPIHGFIRVDAREVRLIDTLIFQRLRHIKQLGLTYLVFPSAQHSRFEHALGVLHLADRLYQSLRFEKEARIGQIIRLAGLLHDLGHPPFSHTTEVLLPKEKTHEDLTKRIILETEIYDILRKVFGFSHEEIELLVRLTLGEPKNDEEAFLTELITGQFGADRMDYLRRDALFCGVSYGLFDHERLFSTVEVFHEGGKRFLVVHSSGLRALESFLIGRYFMYVQVYFHKVVRILNIHLIELMRKIFDDTHFEDINRFLKIDDTTVVSKAFSQADLREDAERIFGRKHFKEVFSTKDRREFEEVRSFLLERFPPELLRFDSVYKEPYDERILVLEGSSVRGVEEVSNLVASLRPIELYRVYADPKFKEEVCSLLRG